MVMCCFVCCGVVVWFALMCCVSLLGVVGLSCCVCVGFVVCVAFDDVCVVVCLFCVFHFGLL